VFEDEGAPAAALAEATEGRGVDVAVLTAGGAAAVGAAAAAVRDGGQVHCFAGGGAGPLPVPLDTVYHRELTITATYSASLAELAEAVILMRRQEALKVYVTP
jgi:threonine dehydrogenase-like Zn-dependent dehydrogenase